MRCLILTCHCILFLVIPCSVGLLLGDERRSKNVCVQICSLLKPLCQFALFTKTYPDCEYFLCPVLSIHKMSEGRCQILHHTGQLILLLYCLFTVIIFIEFMDGQLTPCLYCFSDVKKLFRKALYIQYKILSKERRPILHAMKQLLPPKLRQLLHKYIRTRLSTQD